MNMMEQGTFDGKWEPQKRDVPQEESAFDKHKRTTEESRQKSFKLGHELKAGNLPMFMTGGEIKQHFNPNPGDFVHWEETPSHFWNRKEQEGRVPRGRTPLRGIGIPAKRGGYKTSLAESMQKNKTAPGFISLQPPWHEGGAILGGHHRVALAASQFKDMILPVKYSSNLYEAQDDPHYR